MAPTAHHAELAAFWQRLRQVRRLRFSARTRVATGWHGDGAGRVAVETPAPGVLRFMEAGTWQPPAGPALPFRNVYRWTLGDGRLRLEHLRYGADRPVFLFDLVPDAAGGLRSAAPHPCGADAYAGTLQHTRAGLVLTWTIKGPRKDERIDYVYT